MVREWTKHVGPSLSEALSSANEQLTAPGPHGELLARCWGPWAARCRPLTEQLEQKTICSLTAPKALMSRSTPSIDVSCSLRGVTLCMCSSIMCYILICHFVIVIYHFPQLCYKLRPEEQGVTLNDDFVNIGINLHF